MKIKILQAFHGDSILINFKDSNNVYKNILIDGGSSKTYEYKDKVKGKIKSGDLKLAVEEIKRKKEKIDLLILTHVDDDHIGGILKWFEKDSEASALVGKVWFNSGRLISEYFNEKEIKENLLELKITKGTDTSIKQGSIFEDLLQEHSIWDRKIIKAKDNLKELGIQFRILSPNDQNLKLLLKKWEKEKPDTLTSGKGNDYKISLREHIDNDKFNEDDSIHNSSSIAFILTYKSKNLLFLGDAHPTTVINGLNHFGYSTENPLNAEFVKVSHHGSKANTNLALLKLIKSDKFIISSNGDIHNLPDKQCLARIINTNSNVNLYFNYPEKISEIFSEQDYKEVKFTALKGNVEFVI